MKPADKLSIQLDTAIVFATTYTPMIDEATPGEIVTGPTDMSSTGRDDRGVTSTTRGETRKR